MPFEEKEEEVEAKGCWWNEKSPEGVKLVEPFDPDAAADSLALSRVRRRDRVSVDGGFEKMKLAEPPNEVTRTSRRAH